MIYRELYNFFLHSEKNYIYIYIKNRIKYKKEIWDLGFGATEYEVKFFLLIII